MHMCVREQNCIGCINIIIEIYSVGIHYVVIKRVAAVKRRDGQ